MGIVGIVRVWSDESKGIAVEFEPPARFIMWECDVSIFWQRLVHEHIAEVRCRQYMIVHRIVG